MATDIQLNTKINNAEAGKSLGELNRSLKELIALQGQVASGSAEFEKLSKAINHTESRIGDLKDSFQTLRGSGVERLTASFGLLKEGLSGADPEKTKIGFQGLKAAMSAIPIFLLIEGFKFLADNWKEVIKFGKELFGVFSDEEKAVRSLTKEAEKQTAITTALTKEINREIAVLEASGASHAKIIERKKELIQSQIQEATITAKLNLAKIREVQSNDDINEGLQRIMASGLRKLGLDEKADIIERGIANQKNERNKESLKAFNDQIELIKDLNNTFVVEGIKEQKASSEIAKKKTDDKIAESQRLFEEVLAIETKNQDNIASQDAAAKEKEKKDKEEKEKIRVAEQDLSLKRDLEEIERFNQKENEKRAILKATQEAEFTIAKSGVQSLQGLSDLAFSIKLANTKKGSAEEERSARRQFAINKGLQISSATISGIQGVLTALTAKSIVPEPFATALRVTNAVAVGATTAATIAKISAAQFNSSGGGGGGATTVPASGGTGGGGGDVGGGASVPNQTLTPFAFDRGTVGNIGEPGGKNTPAGQNTQTANVVSVVEITNVMNKVKATESLAKFG